MISLYPSKITEFKTNGLILDEWMQLEITEALNGEYTIQGEYPITASNKYKALVENSIIRVPTPNGQQGFRIYNIEKRTESIVVEGFHLFYDLHGNNIRSFNVQGNGDYAISQLLATCDNPHPFTASSDITETHQFSFSDGARNPIHALLNGRHCLSYLWTGELLRDNFHIYLNDRIGRDTNVVIEYGKNLVDFQNKSSMDEVVTCIIATYKYNIKDANGEDVVTTIMAKADSPLIDAYPYVTTSNIALEDTDHSFGITTEEELEAYIKDTYYTQNGVDKPKFSLTVDWIKQNKYESLSLGDTATIKHQKYNFEYRLRITKYTYDCIDEDYVELYFGEIEGVIEGEIAELGGSISNIEGAVSNHAVSIYELSKRMNDLENPVYYPNQIYNSSFERFNEKGEPDFWETTGMVTSLEHLMGTHSLRLSAGQMAQMKDKPIQCFKWADYSTDFTLRAIGKGIIKVSVLSDGVVQPLFSYVNNQYIRQNAFSFSIDSLNWFDSKYFIELHPTTKTCFLKIECLSGTVYLDCISAIPITQGSKLDIQYTDGAMNYNDVMMVRQDDLLDAKVGDMWFRSDL
jgi:phage minor structural protein